MGTSTTITLKFSNFKNPVNTSPLSGFYLYTEDYNGLFVDESASQTLTGVTSPATITSTSAVFLQSSVTITSVGQTGTDVKVAFVVNVPLQSGCYLKITFPEQIKIDIDESVVQFTGTGFMTQGSGSGSVANGALSKSAYGSGTNSLILTGCTISSQLGKTS